MAGAKKISSEALKAVTADKLYMENNLLRVSGALFCHDQKRARTRTEEIEINRGVKEKHITIRPDPRLGQPGPLAHKIFVALIKKHSTFGRPIQNEVSFTKRELMRLIGRTSWGGSANDQLERALNEIHYTFVKTHFKTNDGTYAEHSFNIFPEVYLERAELATDPIEKCVVTLARPIIQSLKDEHFTCLNHLLMQQLGTIGQALYMRLFFHFSNHYDGIHKSSVIFKKRYEDICIEWLGGVVVLQHKSKIVGEQLGSHFERLIESEFLASYTITDATAGAGYVITFRPGSAFFTDYDRFYRNRNQGELQFQFNEDRQKVADPLKVAYLFIEKKTGAALRDIPYVTSKDTDTARELLERVPLHEMPTFIDYALAQAKRTHFDVQALGGIKRYITGYLAEKEEARAAKEAASKRLFDDNEEAERAAYNLYRQEAADRLFASLPRHEQAVIEGLARDQGRGGFAATNKSFATKMIQIAISRITAEQHADRIASFEDWKMSR